MKLFQSLLFIALTFNLLAQDNWKVEEENDKIKVFTQKTEDSKYKQLRIITQIKAPISEIVAALEDVNHHKNWVYETPESYLIEKRSVGDFDYYVVLNIPFPGKDRDVFINVNRHQDPKTKEVFIESKALKDQEIKNKKRVRIEKFISTYNIKPLENGLVEVDYFLNADPAGKLPAWVVNMFTTKGPVKTMESMIELVESGYYKNKGAENIID